MKIIFISTMNGYSWGGSEELWFNTALFAKSEGHDVVAVVFKNEPIHSKFSTLSNAGIKVHFIDKEKAVMPNLIERGILKVLNKPLNIKYENRFSFISLLNPSVVLLSQGACTDITYYTDLKELFNTLCVPFIVINHYNKENGKLNPVQIDFLKNLFDKSRANFFVSQRNKKVLERQLSYKVDRADIIRNPISPDIKEGVKKVKSLSPSFAIVGRFEVADKGQDILLECIASQPWKEREFSINLYGTGKDETFLRDLIVFYKLQKKVFIKGYIDNKMEIWENNDLLILPSIAEGFPITIVEAMLSGRPCLVTDVGDSSYLINDNINGWIAKCSSVNELNESLERAWLQRDQWEQMGKQAHETAKEFTKYNAAQALYEKIISVLKATTNNAV